jgi:hypothetical protein
MFEGNSVSGDQVEAVNLGEEVLFAELGVFLVALIDVNPDKARKVLRCEGQLRPVFAAVIVALIGSGAAEAQSKTDNKTENGEQKLVDTDWLLLDLAVGVETIVDTYDHVRTLRSA